MSGRNAQLLRILGMIRDLAMAQNGVAIEDLLDRHGVTRRTVERDLAAIEAADYAVETVVVPDSRRIRKRIAAGLDSLQVQVTADELAAAWAGVAALTRDAPASIAATLRMLVSRIEASLPAAIIVDADTLARAQGFVPLPGPAPVADPDMIMALRTAILRCERVTVTYRKGGDGPSRQYVAEPYGLLYGAKGYLVWRGVEDGKWRKFALPYLDRVELTGETFVLDPDFRLADFASDAFGVYQEEPIDVVLRILPEGMNRLHHYKFHPTQTIESHPDGGAIVRFTASGMAEMCWHLFRWEDQALPISPEALVQDYRKRLTRTLAALEVKPEEACLDGL